MMASTKTCPAATKFQYDYLNDDICDDGSVDYALTRKVPKALRDAIAEGKKLLVLINPPYAEAMNADATRGAGDAGAKENVAATNMGRSMAGYGYAARELFVQFLVRIAREIPNATVACFSKMKHVVAPNFESFRDRWDAKYLGGFVVHSKAFEGLKGDFPIGFLIWKLQASNKRASTLTEIHSEVIDKFGKPIGSKTFRVVSSSRLLGDWIVRAKPNDTPALPLSKAMTPVGKAKDLRGDRWADDAIGGLISLGSDVQHSMQTALLSSGYCSAGGLLVTKTNIDQVAAVFTVRRIVKHKWVNDRDQFTAPTESLTADFTNDCLVWMLFNNGNQTVGADGIEWQGKKWSLVNHFIPFTEAEVGAPGRFESDFMLQHLKSKRLSTEAKAVLAEGKRLWVTFFEHTDTHKVRKELRLNRPDVGWHQIRNSLKLRNSSDDFLPVSTAAFDGAYNKLTEKIRPEVYTFGFLQKDD